MAASGAAKKIVYVAFDIETTGQRLAAPARCPSVGKDEMFAIGWAASTGARGQIALNLRKPADTSWRDWWKARGWEMRCYDEFWCHHEDKLDKLQDPKFLPVYETNTEMMEALASVLLVIEEGADEVIPLVDTAFFDAAWITSKMMRAGFESMLYRRDRKGMMWGRDVNSFLRGVYNVVPGEEGAAFGAIKRKLKARIPNWSPDDAHLPESDAVEILGLFVEAKKVSARRAAKAAARRSAKRQRV